MSSTSRELVRHCVTFNSPSRVPRHMWTLPWAEARYPQELAEIRRRFPDDIVQAPDIYNPSPRRKGDAYAIGDYTDEWGCVFENLQAGVIGEVKHSVLSGTLDPSLVKPPYETLPTSPAARDKVNRF